MYGIILSNIRCSFVCVSIEQLAVRIYVGSHCTVDRGEEAALAESNDDKVILRTCNIQ